jgi:ABC-type sugar transport system substrate-binding protein
MCTALLTMTMLSQAMAAERSKIIYLIPSRIDEFQTESQKAIEVVFNDLGYDVQSFDAEDDTARQIAQFDEAIQQQPVAIILNAVDSVSIIPAITKANQKKIPVLVYDRFIARPPRTEPITIAFSSGANAYGIGQMAAVEAKKLLGLHEGDETPSTNFAASPKRILHIPGDPRDDYSLEVQRGFEAGMRLVKDVTITAKPAIDWEPRDAEKILRDELSQKHVFDLIFCHASHLIQPLLPLVERSHTFFMSANGAPNGLKNLKQGKQDREIEQPLYAQVYGLALGFQEIVVRKTTLPPGVCNILGVDGQIENTEIGPVLKLSGTVIRPEDLQAGPKTGHSYWGNFVPPQQPTSEIRCDPR